MFTRLSLALLLLSLSACLEGSPPVNVGPIERGPDAARSTVEVVPATGIPADGQAVARIIVTVRNRDGRALVGQAVSITATGSGNSLLRGQRTGVGGVLEGTLASTVAETKKLTVKVGPAESQVTLVQSPEVTFVAAGSPRIRFITQPPASVRAGEAFSPAVQLRVEDSQGTVVTTPVAVTLALEPASSGATLGGTVVRATSGGMVSFDNLRVERAGAGYKLRATSPGLISAESTAFDITAGPVDPTKTTVEVSRDPVVADGTDSTQLTVTARDTYGNPVPNQVVGFTVSGSGNLLSAPGGTTGADGRVSVALRSTMAELKTVQATVGTILVPQSPQVRFVSGSGARLAFVVHPPAQTVAGQPLAPAVEVEVLDAQGNRAANSTLEVTLTLEPASSGATLGGTVKRAAVAGVARFDDLSVQKAGTGYTLRATGDGINPAVSNAFEIIAGTVDLSKTTVQADRNSVVADGTDFTTLTVTTVDAFFNPVSGQTVGLSATGSNNTLSPTGGTTGANGQVSATLRSTRAEDKTVNATVNGTSVSQSATVTFTAGPAARLNFFLQPPEQTVAGQPMASSVGVEVLDAQGNRMLDAALEVTLVLEPVASGATLGGTTTKAVAAGVASFGDLSVQKAGTGYTLRATAPGLTAGVSNPFNIVAGAVDPSKTTVQVSKNSVVADNADSTTITVTAMDTYGNPVSGQTVGLSATGSNNTLSSSGGTTGADGQVTATLRSTRAEVKTVNATLNGAPVSQSPTVTFVPGPPVQLAFVVQPPDQTVAGQTLAPAVEVEALDAQANRVPSAALNVTLTLEPVASGATLGGTTTKAVTAGVASFGDLSVQKAGVGYTLRATTTLAGVAASVSETFDIVAGAVDPSKTTVQVSKNSVVADNVDSTTITVTTTDVFGNPVPGQTVGVSVTGSNNTLSSSGGTTGANGQVTVTLRSTRAEVKTVNATLNGAPIAESPAVTFIPGPPVKLAFIVQPPDQTIAGQTLAPAVEVEALDAQGNRTLSASLNVTLTLEPVASGATLGGTPTKAVAAGVASFGDLSVQKAGVGYTLRATTTLTGVAAGVSETFDIIADAPSLPQTTVEVSKSSVVADDVDSTTLTVTVKDAFGNPVSGQTVGLSVTGSNNTLSSSGGTTGANGQVTATLRSTRAEVKTVNATLNGAAVPQSPTVTFVSGPPVSLEFSTQPPSHLSAGQTMAPAVVLEVLDAQGNRVTNSIQTLTLVLEPVGGATLGGTVTRDTIGGLASFNDLFVERAGAGYTLRASATGLIDALSDPFEVAAGAPVLTKSSLTVAPASVAADNVAVATITVTVNDTYGNPVSNQQVSLTVSGVNNTLDVSSGPTGAAGTFVAKLRSKTAEVKNIDATAGALTLPPTSVTFVAGPVATLNLLAIPTELEANGVAQTMLTATAEDAFGNRVPNVPVVFTAPGAGNVFSPGDGNTDVNGQRLTGLRSTSAGVKTVSATAEGKVGVALVTFLRPSAQVSGVSLPISPVAGCATVQYTVAHPQSVRADISVEYEEGGVFKRATQAGSTSGSGVQGVRTSPTGVTHVFHWNSTADLPASNPTLRLRVTALVPGALPHSAILANVPVANGFQFGAPGLLPAGTAPQHVARADLNGDGRTDVVVGSPTSNELQVLLGNSSGSFGAATAVSVGVGSSALLVRDMDGDGKADVLTGGATGANVFLLKGTGTGTFGAATVAVTLQSPAAGLVAGDFNRDGKLDLAATGSAGTVEVALATTAGVFGTPTRTNVGGSPRPIAVADLNLDSRLDILFGDSNEDVKVLMGTGSGTFGSALPAGVGAGTVALAVSDLNRDGRPDVVAARGSSGVVSVARGNGDGSFTLQTPITTGGQPSSVTLADMDMDGNRDAVVTGVGNDVLILRGLPDGSLGTPPRVVPAGGATTSAVVLDADLSGRPDVVATRPAGNGLALLLSTQVDRCEPAFVAGTQLPLAGGPSASAVADLNADGRMDLVVAASTANTLHVALGLGNGTFAPFTSTALGTGATNPQGVATGDFNGDGRVDLVSVNNTTSNLSVLLDDGVGGYTVFANLNTGASPRAVAVADMDEDGKLDFVVANGGASNVMVLYGNGDGTFPVTQTHNVGTNPQAVVVADFNADGRLDIGTANIGTSTGTVTVLRNSSGRSFTSMGNFQVGTAPRSIATGDFNNDHKLDVVVANASSNSVSLLTGRGDGGLNAAFTLQANATTPEFREPRGVVAADFDLDGKLDVATANNLGNSITVLPGLGDGRLIAGPSAAAGTGLTNLQGADLDGDGRTDLVATLTGDNRVAVLRSRGSGVASAVGFPALTPVLTANATALSVADMNKDGKLDIVTADRSAAKMSVLLGDGVGGFSLPIMAVVGNNPTATAVGDVNRDGNLDVVVGNGSGNSFSILMGNGNGSVGTAINRQSSSPSAVVLEDINMDGAPDIVGASSSVLFHLNDGTGTFGNVTTVGSGGTPRGIAVADFNRDGRPDVAAANLSSTATVGVLLGTGTGGFITPAKVQPLGANGLAIAAADFDRDGKMDVAVVTGTVPNLQLRALKGVGDGTFTAMAGPFPVTAASPGVEGLIAGDVDGDGRPDIALVIPTTDNVLVWRGNGAGGFTGPVFWTSAFNTLSVTLADFNGDGLPDLATGGSLTVGVLLGR